MKTRSNTAAAILSNTKDLEEAYKSAMEAEGSALAENEKYLDSIQGRIDIFNNAIQTMWSNTLDDSWVKGFVDIGTQLVKWVDNLGLIKTLFMGIGTILIQKYFKGDLIGGLFGGLLSTESVQNAKTRLQELKSEVEKAQAAFDANHSKDNEKYLNRAKSKYAYYKDAVGPQIEKYDKLEEKLLSLKQSRQSLSDEFNNSLIRQNKDVPLINQQIDDIQKKLNIAKQQLEEAKKADWDYYKKLGSKKPAKDRDNRIAEKTQEIEQYEEALRKLQAKKQELESSPDTLAADIDKLDAEIKQVEIDLQNAGTSGLTAFQKIKIGAKTAGKAVWQFGKEMLKSMAWSMAITAVLESITIIGGWIGDAWNYFKPKTFEDLQEELEQTKSELSNVESEISNLNTELDNTNDRIEELMSQGSLTYVEQEELNKLKATTKELQAQIALNETLKKSLQTSTNSQSIDATNSYLGTSFMSDQTKTEKQEEWGETGEEIGKVVGTAGGAVFGAKVLGSIGTIGGPLGTAIGAAIGAMLGGLIGTLIGEGAAGVAYDSEETVGEAMDNMIAKRAELKKTQDEALANNDVEAYNEATEALTTYDTQMAKHISQIQENYNAMDWETATQEQKKQMIEYADWLSKYNISMGTDGAKSNTIARMFGEEASGAVKDLKADIEDAMKAARDADIEPNFDFQEAFNSEKFAEFKERLYELGLTVTDVELYFEDLAEAEAEAAEIDFTDIAKDINSVTESVLGLKSAFEEAMENGGILSAKTVIDLEPTFNVSGLEDEWLEYSRVMLSGVASTEEMEQATAKLATAFIKQKILLGDLTEEQKHIYVAQLRELGVLNADELIDDMLQEQGIENLINEYGQASTESLRKIQEQWKKENGYTDADSTRAGYAWSQLSESDIQELADTYGIVYTTIGELSEEAKQDIIDKYGLEADKIDGIVDKLNEKLELEQQIKALEQEQNDYDEWYDEGENSYKKTLDRIDHYQKILTDNGYDDTFDPNQWLQLSGAGGIEYLKYDENGYVDERLTYDEFQEKNRIYQRALHIVK